MFLDQLNSFNTKCSVGLHPSLSNLLHYQHTKLEADIVLIRIYEVRAQMYVAIFTIKLSQHLILSVYLLSLIFAYSQYTAVSH